MEFWGTEVAPRKSQTHEPGDDTYVHVSQAALGPSKDGKSERVVIRVASGGKNVVLGTLAVGKVEQMTLDLIFDREFKLSHTSTSSSVFFCGYRTDRGPELDDESDEGEDEDEQSDDEDDEPVPGVLAIKQNGTVPAKGAKGARKETKVIEQLGEKKTKKADSPKSRLVEQAEDVDSSAEDDDEEDDDEHADRVISVDFDTDDYDEEDDSEFEEDDESGSEAESDEEDEDDEDDEEEEDGEDVVAVELGKKRSFQVSAKKTPVEGKKLRLDTPAKPGLIITPGKKGVKKGVDTKSSPVSTKQSEEKGVVGKMPPRTPGKDKKAPKSEKTTPTTGESAKKLGTHHCAECSRNFASESALGQHSVAKHKK